MVAAGRGAIVNVASMMGLSGGGLYPNLSYHSSKGGVVNLTRALAVEWAGQACASTRSRRPGSGPSSPRACSRTRR
jgi:NAD(P)-dependent dehydrogenase (short-subunit alcohol dehydrogenase family)